MDLWEQLKQYLAKRDSTNYYPEIEKAFNELAHHAGLSADGPHDDPDFWSVSGVRFALWLIDNQDEAKRILSKEISER